MKLYPTEYKPSQPLTMTTTPFNNGFEQTVIKEGKTKVLSVMSRLSEPTVGILAALVNALNQQTEGAKNVDTQI